MEDKQGRQYCIACEEVDKPSVAQKQEGPQRGECSASSVTVEKEQSISKIMARLPTFPISDDDPGSILASLSEAKFVLITKLRDATKRLSEEENSAACINYASLIKAYAEALTAITEAAKQQK